MKYVKEMETMNSLLKDMYQQIETEERVRWTDVRNHSDDCRWRGRRERETRGRRN